MHESYEGPGVSESSEKPIDLTQLEFWNIQQYSFEEDEEKKKQTEALLAEKGIKINSGNIKVSVDGRIHTITTSEKDFGTIDTNGAPDSNDTAIQTAA